MDLYLFQKINGLAGQFVWLDGLGVFFARFLPYILTALVFFIFWKRWRVVIFSFLPALLICLGIVRFIRFLWFRPRPFVENQVNLLVAHSNTGAFPSAHTAFFFALSAVVFRYNKKAGFLFFAGAILISFFRIFVGVHWPGDILAGILVGIFSGWLAVKVFGRLVDTFGA